MSGNHHAQGNSDDTTVFCGHPAGALMLPAAAQAAAPGITGSDIQSDGAARQHQPTRRRAGVLMGLWLRRRPDGIRACGDHQCKLPDDADPGPTLIVTEGQTVTVNLTNNLPTSAGNTSMLFPGFTVHQRAVAPGLLTQEAAHGQTVTYTFVGQLARHARLLQRHTERSAD